jgi:hypothetical protein
MTTRYEISFSHNDSESYPCRAVARRYTRTGIPVNIEAVAIGKTWEEAERDLIKMLEAKETAGNPPPPKRITFSGGKSTGEVEASPVTTDNQ